MKKSFYLGMALCLALVGCTNDDLAIQPVETELKATVETSLKSRVGFDYDESAKKWDFYWHNNDKIWVNGDVMTTSDPDKTTSATFTGFDVNVSSGYAVYPYGMTVDASNPLNEYITDNKFTLTFPNTYDLGTQIDKDYFESYRNVPMYAKVENGTASFKHLGSLLLIRINGWEKTGAHQLVITTSKKITGAFEADFTEETPVFSTADETENDNVTITFERPADAGQSDMVFYLPLPIGTYDFNVQFKHGEDLIFNKTYKNKTIERAEFNRLIYGESTLVGGSGDYKTVTKLSDITDTHFDTSKDELTVKVDQVSATDNANGGNTVTLPADFEAETLTISIGSVEDGSKITINDPVNGDYSGKVIVEVPVGETIPELEANIPDGEVYIKQGDVMNLVVSAHSNTTIIGSGVTVTNLTVKKGNVRIEEGGAVTNIAISEDNQDGVTYVTYEGAEARKVAYVTTLDDLKTALADNAVTEIKVNKIITVPANSEHIIDMNGKTITGTDTTNKNFSILDNSGTLTIKNSNTENEGKLTLTATINSGWNRYSAVIANNPGGNLTVESGVVIEHLGGTDMAYGIDNLTNGMGTSAVTTIDGATVKSTYRAIRQFLNGIEATNELYVKSGTIEGANKSIWMQDPNKNANTGKLVVSEEAQLKGDVYLFVTAGSEEWPVEVSIAKKALVGESEVLTGNVPEGYEVVLNNGNYVIKKVFVSRVSTLEDLNTALTAAGSAGAGYSTIYIESDIDMTGQSWTPISIDGYNGADIVTVEGGNHVITGLTAGLFAGGFAGGSGIVIKDLTIDNSAIIANKTQGYGAFVGCADSMDEITLINCHLKNSSIITPNDGADESRIGGLIGWTAGYSNQNDGPVDSYITVKDCSVTGCTLKGFGSIGGIVGHAGANKATYTTIENCTVTGNTFSSTDDGGWRVGVVVGTANNGQCAIKNITESNNTLEQTGKTAPIGEKRNYYGRFVPAGTGTLTIDGTSITE